MIHLFDFAGLQYQILRDILGGIIDRDEFFEEGRGIFHSFTYKDKQKTIGSSNSFIHSKIVWKIK